MSSRKQIAREDVLSIAALVLVPVITSQFSGHVAGKASLIRLGEACP